MMPSIVATLRDLHRLHKLVRDLQEQIAEGPSLLTAQQAQLARAEADLSEAQLALKRLKVSIHEQETVLKATHQQIAKYEKQRDTAASKKELDAFDHEIGHGRQKCSQLEDEILTGLGEIDERTAKLPEIERELIRVRQEASVFQAEAEERQQRLVRELDRARSELTENEQKLPDEVRREYARLVASHGGAEALAALRDRTCTACNGSLTLQTVRELEGGGRFVTCKGCGRALYV